MEKTYYIKGMHCISCEMLIEKEFENIKGLKIISFTHKTGKIELEYDDEDIINQVKKLLEKNNYSLEENKPDKKNNSIKKNSLEDYIVIILLFVIFSSVYFLFSNSDFVKYLPTAGSDISIFSALLIGIGASLSTCLAMLGGIVVGFSVGENGDSKSLGDKLKTQFSFHVGRILSFILLGGLLGKLGSFLSLSGNVNGTITILISLVILYIGLHMLNIVPSVSKLGLHLPKSFTKKIHNNKTGPFLIGIFTFFIPCGFTQAMQLASIASGGFSNGSMIMGMFALGTMPVLLGLGLMSSYSSDKKHDILKKVIGVLVIFFSIIGISNSINLVSIGNNNNSTKSNISVVNSDIEDSGKIEEISVKHNGSGTEPYEIKIKSFTKYNLNIIPENDPLGCMTTITIPGVDESVHRIVKGEKIVFNIRALSPGTYKLVCSAMGMTHGKLVVE